MVLTLAKCEIDEDEGSPPRGGVNHREQDAGPGRWENRQISGSPPEPNGSAPFPLL